MSEQKILNVRVDERIMAALAERANDLDITVSELVRSFLDEGLAIKRAKPNPLNPNPDEPIILPTTRLELYRFYDYWNANHPIVASTIDYFAARGPGFMIGCDAQKDGLSTLARLDRLHRMLDGKAESIMRELGLKGDAFVMANIDCPNCDGQDPTCPHTNGSVQSVSILDPATVEVYLNGSISDQEDVFLLPNNDLKQIVKNRRPKELYSRMSQELIDLVAAGKPIKINPIVIAHGKVGGSNYESYGTSIIRGLLPDLMKEDRDRRLNRPTSSISIDQEVLENRIAAARLAMKGILEKILNLQTSMWEAPTVTVSWPADYSRRCPFCTDYELAAEAEAVFEKENGKILAIKEHFDGYGMMITYEQIAQHFEHHKKMGRLQKDSL